jgi:hypothetical protein
MRKRTWLLSGLVAVLAVGAYAHSPTARAEIVETDAMLAPAQVDQDRAKVQAFIDQATVKQELKTMGVNAVLIDQRLAALSPEEIHTLAQRIDSMPAGGAFTDMQLVIILLIAILIAVIV